MDLIIPPPRPPPDGSFSTLQFLFAGVGVTFEPVVLDFLKLLLVHTVEVTSSLPLSSGGPTSDAGTLMGTGEAGGFVEGTGLPFTLTPLSSIEDVDEDNGDSLEPKTLEQNRMVSFLKILAVKVLLLHFMCMFVYLFACWFVHHM